MVDVLQQRYGQLSQITYHSLNVYHCEVSLLATVEKAKMSKNNLSSRNSNLVHECMKVGYN